MKEELFKRGNDSFTLVEIMIVIAIIGLLTVVTVPSFIRARQRSQAVTILNEARILDAAKAQYATENNKPGSLTPDFPDLTPYLKQGTKLATNGGNDLLGYPYVMGTISGNLQINTLTKNALSDSTGGDLFWGPYS